MKKITLIGAGILLLFSGGIMLLKKTPAKEVELVAQEKKKEVIVPAGPYVKIAGLNIPVTIADEPAEVTKGLSGTLKLSDEAGMYFVFKYPDKYRFWMPDMNFPIDIIWIEGGKIVGIDENVSNEFNPANPRFYTPPVPVHNVLEVNAGFSAKNGIAVGMDVATYFPVNE